MSPVLISMSTPTFERTFTRSFFVNDAILNADPLFFSGKIRTDEISDFLTVEVAILVLKLL